MANMKYLCPLKIIRVFTRTVIYHFLRTIIIIIIIIIHQYKCITLRHVYYCNIAIYHVLTYVYAHVCVCVRARACAFVRSVIALFFSPHDHAI
jgi:hypothetical protein